MRTRNGLAIALVCLLAAAPLVARSKRHNSSTRSAKSFDYYLLTLSYAPDFCDQPGGNKDPRECGVGRKIGFVVHGLWPQSETGRGPENCGGSPVSKALVQTMLNYIPTESLIQHEWTTHGTCSGLSAKEYFAQIRNARDGLKIPADLAQPHTVLTLNAAKIETDFGKANGTYPEGAFHTSCYNNAELQEVRVCLAKDLLPRNCPASLPDCSRPAIKVNPVR